MSRRSYMEQGRTEKSHCCFKTFRTERHKKTVKMTGPTRKKRSCNEEKYVTGGCLTRFSLQGSCRFTPLRFCFCRCTNFVVLAILGLYALHTRWGKDTRARTVLLRNGITGYTRKQLDKTKTIVWSLESRVTIDFAVPLPSFDCFQGVTMIAPQIYSDYCLAHKYLCTINEPAWQHL